MTIKKLSTKKHWDTNYQEQLESKSYLKNRRFLSYSEVIFWEIAEKYLPKGKFKILEVGSAPGVKLVEFHKKMGYEPYGIEYSSHGCELNKEVFKFNNCNPKNVLQADFLSDEFQNKYKNSFDIVTSFGFIEHFDNVEAIINKHYNLLKKDGYILITIPNFKGINFHLRNYFAGKESMKMHNLEIMDIDTFNRLFDKNNIKKIYSNYYGIFDFFLIYYPNRDNIIKNILYYSFFWINVGLSIVFKVLTKIKLNNKLENKKTSPFIIYIGKKR
ncbi:MAG: methyltransferase domain-containing protein [Methanobacteriaceae archaeon]|nr:methyltransferase domain-containing protein [Methanobacteriaceae archaeon]